MNPAPFNVYYGPQDDPAAGSVSELKETQRSVTVPLGEIVPLLAEAVRSNRTWLHDFDNDEVTISTDLYEVLLAYQYYRRPSAS